MAAKYKTRDETIRIRRADAEELSKGSEPEPEFRLYVSPIANGWWTRGEVEALVAKLQTALNENG